MESDRFAFVNIIGIMKQLDLAKQRKTLAFAKQPAETTRVPAQPTANSPATRQTVHEEHRKHEEAESHPVESSLPPRNNPTLAGPTSQREKHREAEKGLLMRIVDEPMSRPMTSLLPINDRNEDSSEREGVVNRPTYPFPGDEADRSSSIVSSHDTVSKSPSNSANLVSVSQLCNPNAMETSSFQQSTSDASITDDPLFYVCTSYAKTSSQKSPTLSRIGTNSELNLDARSIPSLPLSVRSSQSFPYYDYCLSERAFDFTPPSQAQSTPSEVARMTARAKEAEIFRQIEGNAFDENAFFNSTRMPIFDDDDVAMLPIV